jgi:hypothetical protein
MPAKNIVEYNKKSYQLNREKLLAKKKADRLARPLVYWEKELKREFGITVEQYRKMLEHQGGKCATCGHPPKIRRLSVDHDHKTGRVRGLLCGICNHYRIGRDQPRHADIHRRIADYLESTFDGRTI